MAQGKRSAKRNNKKKNRKKTNGIGSRAETKTDPTTIATDNSTYSSPSINEHKTQIDQSLTQGGEVQGSTSCHDDNNDETSEPMAVGSVETSFSIGVDEEEKKESDCELAEEKESIPSGIESGDLSMKNIEKSGSEMCTDKENNEEQTEFNVLNEKIMADDSGENEPNTVSALSMVEASTEQSKLCEEEVLPEKNTDVDISQKEVDSLVNGETEDCFHVMEDVKIEKKERESCSRDKICDHEQAFDINREEYQEDSATGDIDKNLNEEEIIPFNAKDMETDAEDKIDCKEKSVEDSSSHGENDNIEIPRKSIHVDIEKKKELNCNEGMNQDNEVATSNTDTKLDKAIDSMEVEYGEEGYEQGYPKAQMMSTTIPINREISLIDTDEADNINLCDDSHDNSMNIRVEDHSVPTSDSIDKPQMNEQESTSPQPPLTPQRPRALSNKFTKPVSPFQSKMAEKIALAISREDQKFSDLMSNLSGSKSESGDTGPLHIDRELVRGAFNTLSNSTNACISPNPSFGNDLQIGLERERKEVYDQDCKAAVEIQLSPTRNRQLSCSDKDEQGSDILNWVISILCDTSRNSPDQSSCDNMTRLKELLSSREDINLFFRRVTDQINSINDRTKSSSRALYNDSEVTEEKKVTAIESAALLLLRRTGGLKAFQIPIIEIGGNTLRLEFTSFLAEIATLTGVEIPKGETSRFDSHVAEDIPFRDALFGFDDDNFLLILAFLREASTIQNTPTKETRPAPRSSPSFDIDIVTEDNSAAGTCETPIAQQISDKKMMDCLTDKRNNTTVSPIVLTSLTIAPPDFETCNYHKPPTVSPCPFETAVWNLPSIVLIVLGCLGDPVAVCRMKMVNRFCNRIVKENEYIVMRDAVRLGGLPNHIRPAFWMWITLDKCLNLQEAVFSDSPQIDKVKGMSTFRAYEQKGRSSKWHAVIERDVARAFGNLPPHKTQGNRKNSIVRALMAWGQNHLLRRHRDGTFRVVSSSNASIQEGEAVRRILTSPPQRTSEYERELERSETVSDWGGISPVGSNISSAGSIVRTNSIDASVVLSGNGLTQEMKIGLQSKLETILDVIAAVHEGFGYCQG